MSVVDFGAIEPDDVYEDEDHESEWDEDYEDYQADVRAGLFDD